MPTRAPLATLPMRIGGWIGYPDTPFDRSILDALRVDEYVNRLYTRSNAESLALYVGYYASQRQGDTIHSPLNCLPGAGWQPIKQETLSIGLSGRSGAADQVNRFVVENGADRQVVVYWYQLHGRIVASDYRSRMYLVMDALRLNRTDAAMIRIATPVIDRDNPAAEARAADLALSFAQSMYPYLSRYLPE